MYLAPACTLWLFLGIMTLEYRLMVVRRLLGPLRLTCSAMVLCQHPWHVPASLLSVPVVGVDGQCLQAHLEAETLPWLCYWHLRCEHHTRCLWCCVTARGSLPAHGQPTAGLLRGGGHGFLRQRTRLHRHPDILFADTQGAHPIRSVSQPQIRLSPLSSKLRMQRTFCALLITVCSLEA